MIWTGIVFLAIAFGFFVGAMVVGLCAAAKEGDRDYERKTKGEARRVGVRQVS